MNYDSLSHEARELVLYSENEEALYRQEQAIQKNLDRKVKRGVYDSSKAPKIWAYLAESAAKRYAKEFGGKWSDIFPPSARREAASFMTSAYEHERGLKTTSTRRSR